MFDCIKCWNVLCTCGWEYRDWNNLDIVDLFEHIMRYHDREEIMKMLNSGKYIEELTNREKEDLNNDRRTKKYINDRCANVFELDE